MGRDFFLLDAIFDGPDFGAVIVGCKTDQDNFKDSFVGLEIDFVLKLRDERAQSLEEGYSDGIQIGCDFVGVDGIVRVPTGRCEESPCPGARAWDRTCGAIRMRPRARRCAWHRC